MRKLSPAFLLLLIALSVPMAAPRALHAIERDALVVIVARSLPANDISVSVLRQAFRGERVNYAGSRLVPFNHAVDSPERTLFDRVVLGLEPREVGAFWIQIKIRDEGTPPRTLPSPSLGPRIVAAYPGAITYMRSSAVDATVKILTIDGKAPGAQGYVFPRL